MKKLYTIITIAVVLAFAVGSYLMLQSEAAKSADPHADSEEAGHDEREAAGPHGGRIVSFGNYKLEAAIFEDGVPPEFRLYVTDNDGQPVSVAPESVSIALERPDRTDQFSFRVHDGYLQSEQPIAEPHEFGVSMALTIAGNHFDTSYFQEETHGHGQEHGKNPGSLGSFTITPEALAANNVKIAKAGPGKISQIIELPGEIVLNADKVAHIVPRFPGIVLKVEKNLGDYVQAGEVLAVIQSNQSVSPYEVKSLVSGTIIDKHITKGEFVRDENDIYIVADLSTVWIKISVYAKYLGQVKVGQKVRITASGIDEEAIGVIDYIGPIVGERTRTGQARVVLQNPGKIWLPGLFVTAKILVSDVQVPLAVPDDAVQTVEGFPAVFVFEGGKFHAKPVQLGMNDGKMIEILSGLKPGEEYAASNSFLLKAEFGKSEAGHAH